MARVCVSAKATRLNAVPVWPKGALRHPILTELEGTVEFEDLVEGVSITEVTDGDRHFPARCRRQSGQARRRFETGYGY